MAFWENLGKKASETTAKAIQQAKDFAEVTKLNGLISDEEKKIDGIYRELGKMYIEIHRCDPDEKLAELVAQIVEAEQAIKKYRGQIRDIKGISLCEKCGAEVAKDASFCSICGAPVPKPVPADPTDSPDTLKCSKCGAPAKEGMRFCTTCGTPLTAPKAETPAAPVEEAPSAPEPVVQEEIPTETSPVAPAPVEPISEAEAPVASALEEAPPVPSAPEAEAPPEPAVEASIPEEPAGKRFCRNCGEPVDENILFCTKCGEKL